MRRFRLFVLVILSAAWFTDQADAQQTPVHIQAPDSQKEDQNDPYQDEDRMSRFGSRSNPWDDDAWWDDGWGVRSVSDDVQAMRSMMKKAFQDAFDRGGGENGGDKRVYTPDIDFTKEDTEYTVRIDLPGVEKEAISVKVENNRLMITGERKMEEEESTDNFYRMERSFGSFSRTIPLPSDADTENVSAESQNGVLTVTVPRLRNAQSQAREVEIR